MEEKTYYKASIEDVKKELWFRMREKKAWRTKDGKVIPLKDMSDEHLLNIIHWYDRHCSDRFATSTYTSVTDILN